MYTNTSMYFYFYSTFSTLVVSICFILGNVSYTPLDILGDMTFSPKAEKRK